MTGVQTCALPISNCSNGALARVAATSDDGTTVSTRVEPVTAIVGMGVGTGVVVGRCLVVGAVMARGFAVVRARTVVLARVVLRVAAFDASEQPVISTPNNPRTHSSTANRATALLGARCVVTRSSLHSLRPFLGTGKRRDIPVAPTPRRLEGYQPAEPPYSPARNSSASREIDRPAAAIPAELVPARRAV